MTDLNEAFEKRWRAQPWDALVSEGTNFKEVGRIMFGEGLKEAKGTPTKADAPFTRDELQLLRDRAQNMAARTPESFWNGTYGWLADAADCLDAMMARDGWVIPGKSHANIPPQDDKRFIGGKGKKWYTQIDSSYQGGDRELQCGKCGCWSMDWGKTPIACPCCGYGGGPVERHSGKPWWSGLMYGNSTAFMEDPRAALTVTAMCASCKEKVSLVEPVPPACPLCRYDGEKK